jgi:hypothetical protein
MEIVIWNVRFKPFAETKSFVKTLLEALQSKCYLDEAKDEDDDDLPAATSKTASPARPDESTSGKMEVKEEPKPLVCSL